MLPRRLGFDRPLEDLAAPIVVIAICAFAVADLMNFGVSIVERVSYAFVYIGVCFGVLLVVLRRSVTCQVWNAAAAWLLLTALFLLPSAAQHYVYPLYIAGDLISMLLPMLLFLVGAGTSSLFSPRSVLILTLAMCGATLAAPLVGVDGGRFEPPPTLLIAIVWWAIHRQRGYRRLLLLCLAISLFVLILGSGQRTALVVWLSCAIYVLWLGIRHSRLHWLFVTAIVASIALATTGPFGSRVAGVFSAYRLATVVSGQRDDSFMARLGEASDVVGTFEAEGGLVNAVFGFGHGATYRPSTSFISRNVTPEGRVHNVHISPFMISFRYGFLGLLAYLALIVAVVTGMRRATYYDADPRVSCALPLAAGCYLIEGLMFNIFVDPLASYSIAGLAATFFYDLPARPRARPALPIASAGARPIQECAPTEAAS